MREAIEDSLFALIAPKEKPDSIRKKAKERIQNSKVYSSVVLEGNKLDEAIQKANEHGEFEYIIGALKPAKPD